MRKLIVLILIMSASFTLQAQQLNGTQEYSNPREFGGSKYSIINWTVNYQILFEQDRYYIRLSYPKVTVSPSSLYGTPNKFYSKSDLGISTWPHTDPTPYNFSLELTLIYPDGSYHKTSAAINENSFIESNSKFKNAGVSSFKVASVEKMNYNGAHDQKLDELIAAKKNGASIASKNTSNSEPSNNNPLTQTGTTSNGVPANTSGNDPLAHYNNPQPTYSNDKTVEAVGQISNALAPMLEEWGNNLQKRRDAEEKRAQDEADRKKGNAESYFKSVFVNKHLSNAENGDENARMILIYELMYELYYGYDFKYQIPKWKEWALEAAKNKNLDAMNLIGYYSIYKMPWASFDLTKEQGFKILEEASVLESTDAMEAQYSYYNSNKRIEGGQDAEKALYWITKAAEKGSSSAMYKLGRIYLYNKTGESFYVKYKIKKNDVIAFNWFLKSISISNYQESAFQKLTKVGSSFHKDSYSELARMFKQGIGCEKNEEMAKKLYEEYKK